MSEPSQETTPAAPAAEAPADTGIPEGIDQVDSVDERAALFLESLGDSAIVPVFSSDSSEDTAPKAKPKPAPAPEPDPVKEPEPAPAPTPAETRAQKFARLRAEEAAKHEHRRRDIAAEQRMAEIDRVARGLEEERRHIEPLLRIAKSKDLMALNEFVQEHFAPEEVAAAVSSWMSDEAREKWRARSAKMEAKSEVQKEIEELRNLIKEAVIAPQQKQQEAQQQQAVYDAFAAKVREHASDSPFCMGLLNRNPKALFALADQTANLLPKGWTFYDVIDTIERTYQPEPAPPTTTAPPSTGLSATTNAAAKATTVTNRHAADRTVVTEGEEPEEGSSIDERAERLKQLWNGSALQPHRR